jgi:hypothetical protein
MNEELERISCRQCGLFDLRHTDWWLVRRPGPLSNESWHQFCSLVCLGIWYGREWRKLHPPPVAADQDDQVTSSKEPAQLPPWRRD